MFSIFKGRGYKVFNSKLRKTIADHVTATQDLSRAYDAHRTALDNHDTEIASQVADLRNLLDEVRAVVDRVSDHGDKLQAISTDGIEKVTESTKAALLTTLSAHRRTCSNCKRLVHKFRVEGGAVECEDCEIGTSR
jgi:hypothetical protein